MAGNSFGSFGAFGPANSLFNPPAFGATATAFGAPTSFFVGPPVSLFPGPKVQQCKYCKKIFDGIAFAVSNSVLAYYNPSVCKAEDIVCKECVDARNCVACDKIFRIKSWNDHKCIDCHDIATKFWAKTLPGDVIANFGIEIPVEITTCNNCGPYGCTTPAVYPTPPRPQPSVKTETLLFPIQSSLLDRKYFDDNAMSHQFKKLIERDVEYIKPGCISCKRVYKTDECKLIPPVTLKKQLFGW